MAKGSDLNVKRLYCTNLGDQCDQKYVLWDYHNTAPDGHGLNLINYFRVIDHSQISGQRHDTRTRDFENIMNTIMIICHYFFLDVDGVIWLVEMCHMMLKYQVLFP